MSTHVFFFFLNIFLWTVSFFSSFFPLFLSGLERRVESQRRELKLNEQTMELMDQSRKLAEDQAYEAQRKTRYIEKESLKSPHVSGRGDGRNGRRSRSPYRDGRSGRNSRSPTSIEYTKITTTNSPDPRTGLPYINGEQQRQQQKYDRSGAFLCS